MADDAAIQRHQQISFDSPEEINDSQQTAPSKRIVGLNPGYAKVSDGVRISQKIGLTVMRAQCPHFNEWIGKLEAWQAGEEVPRFRSPGGTTEASPLFQHVIASEARPTVGHASPESPKPRTGERKGSCRRGSFVPAGTP